MLCIRHAHLCTLSTRRSRGRTICLLLFSQTGFDSNHKYNEQMQLYKAAFVMLRRYIYDTFASGACMRRNYYSKYAEKIVQYFSNFVFRLWVI